MWKTDWRIERNWGFSVKEEGVGGRVVVVPMAREGVGGEVRRRVRMCMDGFEGWGNT